MFGAAYTDLHQSPRTTMVDDRESAHAQPPSQPQPVTLMFACRVWRRRDTPRATRPCPPRVAKPTPARIRVQLWTTINVTYCVGAMWLCLVRTRRKTVAMLVEIDELYKQLVRHSGVRPSVRAFAGSDSGHSSGGSDNDTRAITLAYLREVIAFIVYYTSKRSNAAQAAREPPQEIEDGFLAKLFEGPRSIALRRSSSSMGGSPVPAVSPTADASVAVISPRPSSPLSSGPRRRSGSLGGKASRMVVPLNEPSSSSSKSLLPSKESLSPKPSPRVPVPANEPEPSPEPSSNAQAVMPGE
jgi:hypothetical protein